MRNAALLANDLYDHAEILRRYLTRLVTADITDFQLQIEALGPRALRAFGHGENASAEVLLGTPEWPAHVPGRTAQFLYLRAATIFGGYLARQSAAPSNT